MKMARFLWVVWITVSWFSHSSLGGFHEIVYNEEELLDSCVHTCGTLPDRTNMFGCERISNCRFNKEGWNKGFVRCDWCSCQCRTSDDLPDQVIFSETKIIKEETELFNTCTDTCEAPGIQFTNKFNCDQIRDCSKQRSGYIKGFVRCDYCECTCVTKVLPDRYRLENVHYKLDAMSTAKKDQLVVGTATFQNNKGYEVTFSRTIKISFTTERRWDLSEQYGTSLSVGASVGINALGVDFSAETTLTTSFDYTVEWGETTVSTVEDSVTQSIPVPAHSVAHAQVRGWRYKGSVPYTADLVTIYENGEESRKQVSGVLHEVSVTDFTASVGDADPVRVKRDFLHGSYN